MVEAGIGQPPPVQHFVIFWVERERGVVVVDGALIETLARVSDAAVVIGAEIIRVELNGALELDDGAVMKPLVVEREPPVVVDENQIVRRQTAVFYSQAVEADRLIEFASTACAALRNLLG